MHISSANEPWPRLSIANAVECIAQKNVDYKIWSLSVQHDVSIEEQHKIKENANAETIAYQSIVKCKTFYQCNQTRMGPYALRVFFTQTGYNLCLSFFLHWPILCLSSSTLLTMYTVNFLQANE